MKKKRKAVESDDLFGEDTFENTDDLFSTGTEAATPVDAAASAQGTAVKDARGRLTPEARLARFNELRELVESHIGKHPPAKLAKKPEQIRNTAWQHLFSLATTKEQMEQVVEMMPRWRDAKRVFTPRMTEAFIRACCRALRLQLSLTFGLSTGRCEELHCPTVALQVFANHSKYGVDLPSEQAARQLLHSLHNEQPLQESITLSALLAVYKLPPVSDDLVSCAMLTSACFKANTPQSITVAKALVPSLQGLLANANPAEWKYPTDPHARNQNKHLTWLTWTLTKIEKALSKQKQPSDWLRKWREESGHAQIAT